MVFKDLIICQRSRIAFSKVYLLTMLNRVRPSRSRFTDYSGLTPHARLNVDVLSHIIL